MFPTYQCLQKGCPGFYTLTGTRCFTFLLMTPDLNKIYIKKSRIPFCRHCQVGNVCEISAKNIKLYGSQN